MFNDAYSLTDVVLRKRKTQTRREAKITPTRSLANCLQGMKYECMVDENGNDYEAAYFIGEVVAIAQSYKNVGYDGNATFGDCRSIRSHAGWTNKMFVKSEYLPKHIKIIGVRCERLQDISDEDCLKEGIYRLDSANGNGGVAYSFVGASEEKNIGLYPSPREAFITLIDKVSGKGTWERNPFVWVYEFELIN